MISFFLCVYERNLIEKQSNSKEYTVHVQRLSAKFLLYLSVM